MNELGEKYLSYIDDKISHCNRISEEYKADQRKDEADFERIKVNIYEVFRTLFLSDVKKLEGKNLEEDKYDNTLYNNYLNRFDTIPANWRASLSRAKEHGDATTQVIEETKLAAAEEIKNQFIKMFT